jgi:hypothetical protein
VKIRVSRCQPARIWAWEQRNGTESSLRIWQSQNNGKERIRRCKEDFMCDWKWQWDCYKSVAMIRLVKTENPSEYVTVNCEVCRSAIVLWLPVVPNYVNHPIQNRSYKSRTNPYTWQYIFGCVLMVKASVRILFSMGVHKKLLFWTLQPVNWPSTSKNWGIFRFKYTRCWTGNNIMLRWSRYSFPAILRRIFLI